MLNFDSDEERSPGKEIDPDSPQWEMVLSGEAGEDWIAANAREEMEIPENRKLRGLKY